MSVHLAGLRIKGATKIRWLAHFSDPWADLPLNEPDRLTRRLLRHWESRVVQAADVVIFTSQETLDLVMAKYPSEWAAKAKVLPHAFDPGLYPTIRAQKDTREIVVRHLGRFYYERTPEPLFQGLKRLSEKRRDLMHRVSIELIGGIQRETLNTSTFKQLPTGVVRLVAPVDYVTSLRLMSEADLLLVVDAPADVNVFFPSKLADYIGARRPIVGITPEGTSASIIRELGGQVAHPGDPAAIAGVLEQALGSLPGGSWGDERVRARYCAQEVAKTFRQFLE
jgi:glycosyltransferase involved in cell wall biosynthesis